MRKEESTIHNKTILLALITLALGALAGIFLIQKPIDIRERAADIDACYKPIMRCVVTDITPGVIYDAYRLEIINPRTPLVPLLTGAVDDDSIEMPVDPNTPYECHIKSVDGRCWSKDVGVAPICITPTATPTGGPSATPTSVTPTSIPPTSTPYPTVTPLSPTATPTPLLFPGCPLAIESIEPILCVINSQGKCY